MTNKIPVKYRKKYSRRNKTIYSLTNGFLNNEVVLLTKPMTKANAFKLKQTLEDQGKTDIQVIQISYSIIAKNK